MGKRSDYKKMDEIANNDIDAGCRKIVDTSTPARRRLRDKLRRQARARLEMSVDQIVSSVADEDVESKMVTAFTPTVCVEVIEHNG